MTAATSNTCFTIQCWGIFVQWLYVMVSVVRVVVVFCPLLSSMFIQCSSADQILSACVSNFWCCFLYIDAGTAQAGHVGTYFTIRCFVIVSACSQVFCFFLVVLSFPFGLFGCLRLLVVLFSQLLMFLLIIARDSRG